MDMLEQTQARILAEITEIRAEAKADGKTLWTKVNNQVVSLEKLKSTLTTIKSMMILALSSGTIVYLLEKLTP